MPNTIRIVGGGVRPPEPMANQTITPGHLLEYVSTNVARVNLHASAGGPCQRLFALEQDYIGGGITKTYASGDRVHCLIAQRGARIYAFLASGQNVTNINTRLVSNGNGELKAWATSMTQPESIVGLAAEIVNASSGTQRITVEVI